MIRNFISNRFQSLGTSLSRLSLVAVTYILEISVCVSNVSLSNASYLSKPIAHPTAALLLPPIFRLICRIRLQHKLHLAHLIWLFSIQILCLSNICSRTKRGLIFVVIPFDARISFTFDSCRESSERNLIF